VALDPGEDGGEGEGLSIYTMAMLLRAAAAVVEAATEGKYGYVSVGRKGTKKEYNSPSCLHGRISFFFSTALFCFAFSARRDFLVPAFDLASLLSSATSTVNVPCMAAKSYLPTSSALGRGGGEESWKVDMKALTLGGMEGMFVGWLVLGWFVGWSVQGFLRGWMGGLKRMQRDSAVKFMDIGRAGTTVHDLGIWLNWG
jgi:hypothetical protein